MPFTQYAENQFLNLFTGNSYQAFPTGLYAALFSVAPTKTLPGTEFVDGTGSPYAKGYSRGKLTFNSSTTSVATANTEAYFPHGALISQSATISGSTSNWPAAVAVGLFDAASGGNLWAYNSTGSNPPVGVEGYSIRWANGGITVGFV